MVLLSGKALNKERNNGRYYLDGVLRLAIYLSDLTNEAGWQLGGEFLGSSRGYRCSSPFLH